MSCEPGKQCPTCERRVPFPKKESSPDTKVLSFRIPKSEYDAFKDTLDNLGVWLGTKGRPFEVYNALIWAAASCFKDEDARGVAARTGWQDVPTGLD